MTSTTDTSISESNENMPRVCMVAHLFHPHFSGAGRQALSLSRYLRRNGCEVFFVSSQFADEPLSDTYEEFPIYRIPCRGDGVLALFFYWFRFCLLLFRRRSEYDVVHVQGVHFWHSIAAWWCRLFGKQTVVTVTMAETELRSARSGRFLGPINAFFISHFARFLPLSVQICGELKEMGVEDSRVKMIPGGVDVELFAPVGSERKAALKEQLGLPDKQIVVFVGIVIRRKGVHHLVEAWREAVAAHPEAVLTIIGPISGLDAHHLDGDFPQLIEKKINEYQLSQSVLLLGNKPLVADYLKCADIFVLPSEREGLPNALLEAMASGLPAITTSSLSGAEDVVQEGENGYLVDFGDIESLSKSLMTLLNDREKSRLFGRRSREKIERNYSLQTVADEHISVYRALS